MSVLVDAATPAIRAVVFDLDGTMFNTEAIAWDSCDELLKRRGQRMSREIMDMMIGRRSTESFALVREHLSLKESIEELIAESHEIHEEFVSTRLAPMPGLFELLDQIELLGLPKGVATSSSRPYVQNVLGRYDLESRFQVTLTSEDVKHGKPEPEIYLRAAELLNINPENMLVLEDTEAGTRAAASAGAHIISVPHEHSRRHNFTMAKGVATSLADPIIKRLLRPK